MASELDTVHHNNQQIQRYKSVHFSSKYIKGITHTDILNELEKYINREKVKAIQLTERECVVTVDDQASKILLLIKGIEIKNYHYKFVDVVKEVTHVTIKDAHVELGDLAICTFMRKYGEVVQDSIKRRTIREDKMRIFTSADPYEFSLSPGQSRYQSTQQSRNTPASSISGRIPVN